MPTTLLCLFPELSPEGWSFGRGVPVLMACSGNASGVGHSERFTKGKIELKPAILLGVILLDSQATLVGCSCFTRGGVNKGFEMSCSLEIIDVEVSDDHGF